VNNILINGINYTTGDPLLNDMDENDFSQKILNSLTKRDRELQSFSENNEKVRTFRSLAPAVEGPNKNNPKDVGWIYIIHKNVPSREEIINAITPLAEFRGMPNPQNPLIYNGEQREEYGEWIMNNLKVPGNKMPYYILIVGNPEEEKKPGIPFEFQSYLGLSGAVGRLDFDSIDDLKNYVSKIIHLEQTTNAVVNKEVITFATDSGFIDRSRDPTYYSRNFLAEPLSNQIEKFGYNVNRMFGSDATKENLKKALSNSKPAMVFTASHGFAAPDESLDIQKEVNGAICCQRQGNETSRDEYMFSGNDVPTDSNIPFLEGSVFVQFACFGGGTPKESIFNKWLDQKPKLYAPETFTSSLPKKLLSHPRGPIGYIAHLDVAFLHGFANPENPDIVHVLGQQWDSRIHPFYTMLETILKYYQPNGRSLYEMSQRLAFYSSIFADRAEKMALNELPLNNNKFREVVKNDFIMRNDSKNYLVFGDPAAKI
jgi:hypothetical protein